MFIGRMRELSKLNELHNKKKSTLAVIYGRRRIGKSVLVEHFIENKKYLKFQGLEGLQTPDQIASFTRDLAQQINDPLLKKARFTNWEDIFDFLTDYFKKNPKTIFFIDEFQWLAASQSSLVSIMQKYWETSWKKQNIMLILCGSISSYMVKNVIKSTAFFGRIDWAYGLPALSVDESLKMLKSKRNIHEVFKYLLIFGGIPKYLESIKPNKSFEQNMTELFFKEDSFLLNEYEKIFYSQFKEHLNYKKIVKALTKEALSLQQVAKLLKFPSGGGVKSYLENLENALFISSYTPFNRGLKSKLKLYKLTDEYLRFYFKFILPNQKIIKTSTNKDLFTLLTKKNLDIWLGFAFENFCLKNAMAIAEKLGFADKVLTYGPFFKQGDNRFQCDLIFNRSDDTITLCELKYYSTPVTTKVISEVEKKCQQLPVPKGFTLEKALITEFPPDQSVIDAEYFHHILTVDDF